MFKELIWVKENSLSESFCKTVIEKFEVEPYQIDGVVDQNNPRVDKSVKVTKDMCITGSPEWEEEDKVIYDALVIALDEYETHLEDVSKEKCDAGWKIHPSQYYENKDTGYKVQKYEPNGYYNWHHDWCMHKGWTRTFTYIWYLNTIEENEGGWTEFIDGTKIQPKAGSILIFPATWTFVHRGYTTKVPKYLINGWIYARP